LLGAAQSQKERSFELRGIAGDILFYWGSLDTLNLSISPEPIRVGSQSQLYNVNGGEKDGYVSPYPNLMELPNDDGVPSPDAVNNPERLKDSVVKIKVSDMIRPEEMKATRLASEEKYIVQTLGEGRALLDLRFPLSGDSPDSDRKKYGILMER